MTRCGHIYCWPCVLHYLALSDKTWRKCPICYEAIHVGDLKSSTSKPYRNFNVGDFVTLQLMRREKGSLKVKKVNKVKSEGFPHISGDADEVLHSKLLLADPNEESKSIETIDKSPSDTTEDESKLIVQDLDITPVFNDSNYFYFYQSRDGQPLYLHSINVRMLQMMYGSLDRGPHVIGGKIVQKEVCSMTEELRKRLKYLQHLPVTSQFEVAELSLGSELLSEEVVDAFKDEIVKRQKLRQRRARDENRREVKINEVNERQIGKILSRSANIDVHSDRQFPSCSGNSPLFNDRDDPPLHLLSSSSDLSASPSTSGPSFATMLSQPKKMELWPSLNATANPSWESSVPAAVSSGGAKKQTIYKRSPYNASDMDDNDDVDDDGDDVAAGPPEFKSDFGTAIAVALEKQMFNAGDGKKLKKKKRNTVLFSTGLPGRSFMGN